MENAIFIKIITPLKTEFKGEASYIEIPTIAGMVGIYANHIPLITALSNGILKLRSLSGEIFEFQVNEGFARFNMNKCTISIKAISRIQNIA